MAEPLQAIGFDDDEKVLDVEASIGVAHYERVANLDTKLVELDSSISLANACFQVAETQYVRLKDSGPF